MKKIKGISKFVALLLVLSLTLFTLGCKKENKDNKDEESIKRANRTLQLHCFDYDTLNPLLNDNETNMQVLKLMFEGLFLCDETMKPQNVLADSYSVSSGGLTWTVFLKPDVKWHDGTTLTAQDVAKTYNDVLEYKEKSPYYALLSNIDYVDAYSDTEVIFRLKNPQANFVNLLDVPIIKYHGTEDFNPVGTGPFVYKSSDNKAIYLNANENWHMGKVELKNVEIKILPDAETSVYAYTSKETDMVAINTTEELGKYTSNSDNKILDFPSNVFTYVGINTNVEPLSNRLFRKALAHAIDKENICSEVLLSHGTVANTFVNPNWWMYKKDITNYKYSQTMAKESLDSASGSMKITPISLMVNSDNADKCKIAEMIRDNLKDCGITMYIDYVDWYAFEERVASGNYQMYIGTVKLSNDVNPAYVIKNPDNMLKDMFATLQKQTDEIMLRDSYYAIQERVASEILIIPLYFDVSSIMYNKRIEGQFSPVTSNVFRGIEGLNLGQ